MKKSEFIKSLLSLLFNFQNFTNLVFCQQAGWALVCSCELFPEEGKLFSRGGQGNFLKSANSKNFRE
jgi:hypothetical protein